MHIALQARLRLAFGIVALAAAAVFGAPQAARAGTLSGDTLHLDFLYPDTSSVYYDLGDFTVPYHRNDLGGYTWEVTGNKVSFTAGPIGAGPFGAAAFNGLKFVDISRNPGITGITLDTGATTATGDIPLVTFSSDTMFFNFAGQQHFFGKIVFDLAFAASTATTPVPGALPLFVSALGGFGLLAWRRRRNGAVFAA
jgi:hypothetical protein